MRRGAVVTAATIGVWLSACALDKPTETTDNTTQTNARSHVSETSAPPGPTVLARGVAQASSDPAPAADAQNTPTANAAAEPAESTAAAQAAAPRDDNVRDAKEAAEEAARKILDVTLGAANKIKEVGLGAVQSVRESTVRNDDADGTNATGELAANGDVEMIAD